jgi:hypothetical protein
VRDAAKADIEALQSKEANGKRFILAPSAVTYSDVCFSNLQDVSINWLT